MNDFKDPDVKLQEQINDTRRLIEICQRMPVSVERDKILARIDVLLWNHKQALIALNPTITGWKTH